MQPKLNFAKFREFYDCKISGKYVLIDGLDDTTINSLEIERSHFYFDKSTFKILISDYFLFDLHLKIKLNNKFFDVYSEVEEANRMGFLPKLRHVSKEEVSLEVNIKESRRIFFFKRNFIDFIFETKLQFDVDEKIELDITSDNLLINKIWFFEREGELVVKFNVPRLVYYSKVDIFYYINDLEYGIPKSYVKTFLKKYDVANKINFVNNEFLLTNIRERNIIDNYGFNTLIISSVDYYLYWSSLKNINLTSEYSKIGYEYDNYIIDIGEYDEEAIFIVKKLIELNKNVVTIVEGELQTIINLLKKIKENEFSYLENIKGLAIVKDSTIEKHILSYLKYMKKNNSFRSYICDINDELTAYVMDLISEREINELVKFHNFSSREHINPCVIKILENCKLERENGIEPLILVADSFDKELYKNLSNNSFIVMDIIEMKELNKVNEFDSIHLISPNKFSYNEIGKLITYFKYVNVYRLNLEIFKYLVLFFNINYNYKNIFLTDEISVINGYKNLISKSYL